MAFEENLKSLADRTTEEQREIARKGGIASGQARKRKADMKAMLEVLLAMPLESGESINPEDVQSMAEMRGKNVDVNTAILLAQIQKAMKGSVMSAQFIRDTAGQMPETLLQLQGAEDNELNISINYGKPKESDNQ